MEGDLATETAVVNNEETGVTITEEAVITETKNVLTEEISDANLNVETITSTETVDILTKSGDENVEIKEKTADVIVTEDINGVATEVVVETRTTEVVEISNGLTTSTVVEEVLVSSVVVNESTPQIIVQETTTDTVVVVNDSNPVIIHNENVEIITTNNIVSVDVPQQEKIVPMEIEKKLTIDPLDIVHVEGSAEDIAQKRYNSIVLRLCCMAQFMVVLDVSVVNVALPSIFSDLGFTDQAELQYVVTAYAMAFGGLLLLGGRVGDYFGRKFGFLLGIFLFTAASVIGGCSNNPTMLIAARALQGVGGSVLGPASLTIITVTFSDPTEKAKAMGAWSATAAGGGAAGALVGGILVQYINWRWILFINVPVGIVLIACGWLYMKESKGDATGNVDVLGALSITGSLVSLVYGISQGPSAGWQSWPTFWAFFVAGILFLAFLILEAFIITNPLVPLSIFKNRSIAGANLFIFFFGIAMFSQWFFISLWIQLVLKWNAIDTGLSFLPSTVAIAIAAVTASKNVPKYGAKPFVFIGALVSAGGLFWVSQITPDSTWVAGVFGGATITSLGMGFCFAPVSILGTAGVSRKQAGLASGLINCSRQIGGSIGLALLSSLADTKTKDTITAQITSLCTATPANCIPKPNASIMASAAHVGLSTGYAYGLFLAAFVLLGSAVFMFIVPSHVPVPASSRASITQGKVEEVAPPVHME